MQIGDSAGRLFRLRRLCRLPPGRGKSYGAEDPQGFARFGSREIPDIWRVGGLLVRLPIATTCNTKKEKFAQVRTKKRKRKTSQNLTFRARKTRKKRERRNRDVRQSREKAETKQRKNKEAAMLRCYDLFDLTILRFVPNLDGERCNDATICSRSVKQLHQLMQL